MSTDSLPDSYEYVDDFNVVVCRVHHIAIVPTKPLDHIKRYHINPTLDFDSVKECLEGLHLDSLLVVHRNILTDSPIAPIEYLEPPKKGYKCTYEGCNFIRLSLDKAKRHVAKQHHISTARETLDHLQPCAIQSLSAGSYLFEVTADVSFITVRIYLINCNLAHLSLLASRLVTTRL